MPCLTDGVRLLKRANDLDPQRVTRRAAIAALQVINAEE